MYSSIVPAAVAYAGLAPREYRSGTSVKKRTWLSKAGNARLRKALYLPALTATQFNPVVTAFYERLVAAGKPKMAALGACLRKLLMIAYGMLKSRTAFDPTRGSSPRTERKCRNHNPPTDPKPRPPSEASDAARTERKSASLGRRSRRASSWGGVKRLRSMRRSL
jgi:hypothetical protein